MLRAGDPSTRSWSAENQALDKSVFGYRLRRMNSTYTAIVKNDGDRWIGWIEEVPGVNAQEKTKADLLQSLREILNEALEFNRAEARSAAESGYSEELVTV